MPSVISVLQQC